MQAYTVNVDGPAGVIAINTCRPGGWEAKEGHPVTQEELANPKVPLDADLREREFLMVRYYRAARKDPKMTPELLEKLPGAKIYRRMRAAQPKKTAFAPLANAKGGSK